MDQEAAAVKAYAAPPLIGNKMGAFFSNQLKDEKKPQVEQQDTSKMSFG